MLRNLILLFLLPVTLWGQMPSDNRFRQAATLKDSVNTRIIPVPAIKQLTKGGIGLPLLQQSTLTPVWMTLGVNITREYKIKQGLSLLGGIETNFSFSSEAKLYSLEVPVGLRYYFSLGQRMKKRADRHSFFSHYIAYQTHNVFFANLRYDNESGRHQNMSTYYRGQFLNEVTNVGNLDEAFNMLQYAYFQIGSQFKLGRSNYLDVNVAVPILIYHKTEYTLSTPALLNIKYGISWQK